MSKVKTSGELKAAAKGKSDAGKAGFRPAAPEAKPIEAPYQDEQRTGDYAAPWDGKKRLDAGEKVLRCQLTEDEIQARKSDLLDMHAQTPALRTAVAEAAKVLKDAKNELAAHEAKIETHAEATKRGWLSRGVECITVLENRQGIGWRVCYRTDTGKEAIPAREASTADVQESIPGA